MNNILNNLPDPIALLDSTTAISETNLRWEQNYPNTTGLNFLQFHEQKTVRPDSRNIQQAIQNIMAGTTDEFSCLFTTRSRTFSLQISPIQIKNVKQIMISLRDIATLAPQRQTNETQQQIEQLTETNIALNTLLKSREQDRATLEGAIVTNVKQLIMPYVERLENSDLTPQEQTLVSIIKEYLNNIISPFLHRISTLNQQLTPQELKVASLIRQGRSTKEIAAALGLSVHGIDFHRKSLRTKLGLTGSGRNLRSQLIALR
jgi:DNA-binding CsgD family transcriptional regulator